MWFVIKVRKEMDEEVFADLAASLQPLMQFIVDDYAEGVRIERKAWLPDPRYSLDFIHTAREPDCCFWTHIYIYKLCYILASCFRNCPYHIHIIGPSPYIYMSR